MDVLASMEGRTANAWIFLHTNAVQKLKDICGRCNEISENHRLILSWEATEAYPETRVIINIRAHTDWFEVFSISASDIAFTVRSRNPENLYFLKMDE